MQIAACAADQVGDLLDYLMATSTAAPVESSNYEASDNLD